MCISHGVAGSKSNGFEKEKTKPKSIPRPNEQMMKKGDPDFIDLRTKQYQPKDRRSLFQKLVDFLSG